MKVKPKTPYQRLLEAAQDFAFKVAHGHRVQMFYYPKEKLEEGWRLFDLYERTKAADQLGYNVVMEAKDDGLHVGYVKKCPQTPYEWES